MSTLTPELQDLRGRAFAAMADIERSVGAVEAARVFTNQVSPLVTSQRADAALKKVREELADQLYEARKDAGKACAAYARATVGDWVGKKVRFAGPAGAAGELTVGAILWANWQLGEDQPSFHLLSALTDPVTPDTPCLGAAVWHIEQLG